MPSLGVDAACPGRRRRRRTRRDRLETDAAVRARPAGGRWPGPSTRPSSRRRPGRRAGSPRSGRCRPRPRWCDRRGSPGRGRRSGRRSPHRRRRSSSSCTARRVSGGSSTLAAVDLVGSGGAGEADGRHAGPAGSARRPGRRTRRPAASRAVIPSARAGYAESMIGTPARSMVPRMPSASAISASVNQNRIGPGGAGRGGASRAAPARRAVRRAGPGGTARRRSRCSPGRSARFHCSGWSRGAPARRGAAGRAAGTRRLRSARSLRVMKNSTTSAMIRIGHGNQNIPRTRHRSGRTRRSRRRPRSATLRVRSSRLTATSPVSSSGTSSQQAPYSDARRHLRRRPAPRTPPGG